MLETKPAKCRSMSITWGAWYDETTLDLTFPDHWDVNRISILDSIPLSDESLAEGISEPISSPPLEVIAKGKRNAVIAVEDITRPVRLGKVLAEILKRLYQAGMTSEDVTFVICNGAHAPMQRWELEQKLGPDILRNFHVHNHNPYDNLSDSGYHLGKTPVRLNRYFIEADLRIIVGSIIPHSFAGFSSGAKLVIPGLSDLPTLERTHKYVMMGFRGGVNDVEKNAFRSEIETVVERIGVDFFVGVIPNSKRELAGVFAGNVVAAHRKGVAFARQIYTATFQQPSDVVVLNAYPKDSELLQADAALTPLKTTSSPLITENGVFVLISRCSNGFGHHNLFGPGMPLTRKPIQKRNLNGRDLIVLAPGVNTQEFKALYWNGYTFARTWEEVRSLLESRYPDRCRVSVLPCAPLQLLQSI